MMRTTIVALLALITLAAAGHQEVPAIFQPPQPPPPPPDCACRERTCADTSCEELHILCLVDSYRELDAHGKPWPKGWAAALVRLVQERGWCIKKCVNICSPAGRTECVAAAFDRYVCSFKQLLKEIKGLPGYNEFLNQVQKRSIVCINRDCKSACSGGSCDPFSPAHCDACVASGLETLIQSLTNNRARDIVDEFSEYIILYYVQVKNCRTHTQCKKDAHKAFIKTYSDFQKRLIKAIGSCTALAISSAIEQLTLNCANLAK